MLTPKIAGVHWTLCEAPVSEPWITTDNPVALFEPSPGRRKPGVYGPSLQFLFPISPRFLLFGEPMTPGPDDRGRVPAHTVRMFTDALKDRPPAGLRLGFFEGAAIPGEPGVQGAGSGNRAHARELRAVLGPSEQHAAWR